MKKLLAILSVLFLISCRDIPNTEFTNASEGTIIKVVRYSDNEPTYIEVHFTPVGTKKVYTDESDLWFEGSDTCKVGQKVHLK